MAAPLPLVLSPEPDGANPHGRRYTAQEKEAAYLSWRTLYGRSRRRTAKELNISPSTLERWHAEDGWDARADAEDQEDAVGARVSMAARVLPMLDKALARLEKVIDAPDTPATGIVKATELLANLAGVGPANRGAPPLAPATPPAGQGAGHVPLALLRQLTPSELADFRDRGVLPDRLTGGSAPGA